MEVIIPVRLTDEDITSSTGEFFDAYKLKNHTKLTNKRIFYIVFGVGYIIFMFSLWIVPVLYGRSVSVRKAAPIFYLFAICILYLFNSLQSEKKKRKTLIRANLNTFHNDFRFRLLSFYTLSNAGISFESRTQSSILHWDEVFHLTEFPSCFTIEKSPSKKFVIPRRCFENDQQLRDFRSIVSSNLPASKWSLTGIPLGVSKPDRKSTDSIDDTVPLPDPKDCIYSFTFEISEKEAGQLFFAIFRTDSVFKKTMIFLALLFIGFIWVFAYSPLSIAVIVAVEIVIVILVFLLLKKVIRKTMLTNKALGQEETASFFPDRIVIETRNEHIEYFWNTLSSVKITRAGLFIFLYARCAMFFPVSAINRTPNKQAFLSFVKSRNLAVRK